MSNLTGQQLGPYQLVAQIGAGGMATVYKGFDPRMSRYVAVKVMQFAANDTLRTRFLQEARVVANLEHVHILPVYDFGEENGVLYLVMRLLQHGSLDDRVRAQGALAPGETMRLLWQVAGALDYAHSRGVVHRDLKPANVLLDDKGNAYLADFGLAYLAEQSMHLTGQGFIGTPAYASPEQCTGEEITPASDLYSLALVAFTMFTGAPPFRASTSMGLMRKQVEEPLPDPRDGLPLGVLDVLRRAAAKAPKDRYPNAWALVSALERALRGTPGTRPIHRRPALWLVVLVLAVMLVAAAGVLPRLTAAPPTPALTDPPPLAKRASPTLLRTAGATATIPPLVTATFHNARTLIGPHNGVAAPPTPDTGAVDAAELLFIPGGTLIEIGTHPDEAEAAVAACVEAGGRCKVEYTGDSIPVHTVRLDDFYIERYEVTVGQYVDFLNMLGPGSHASGCIETRCAITREEDGASPVKFDGAAYSTLDLLHSRPMTHVTWFGARAYCAALGRRLPTEAEWEHAARGQNPGVYIYPWGAAFDPARANTVETGLGATRPIGSYPEGASPYGVEDMAGNVAEWVYDWYRFDFYSTEDAWQANPQGPLSGEERVVRGGAWDQRAFFARTMHRLSAPPEAAEPWLGFRCAAD